jgi:hypothetical protein
LIFSEFDEDYATTIDFCAEFDFGADFGAAFSFYNGFDDTSNGFGSHNDESREDLVEGVLGHCRCRRCRTHWPKRTYRIESIKKSCQHQNFTRPGPTRELTYMLANSDRFREFCH